MLDLDITIELYDKIYAAAMIDIFKRYRLSKPVYIVDRDNSIHYAFNSDYHQYEMQREIEALFEGYVFVEDIASGAEVIVKIHIVQSPFSSDSWGRRWNEDAIHTTSYLVKHVETVPDVPKTTFHVLFGDELKEYKVHLGVSKTEPFYYVVLKDDLATTGEVEFLADRRFETPAEAFWAGYRLLTPAIEEAYENYQKELKKAARRRKKSPPKEP